MLRSPRPVSYTHLDVYKRQLLGFALVKLGERVVGLRKLAGEASDTMIQVTRFVLEMTPLGTFGLIAALVGAYGFEKLLPLGTFVFALYLACALHIVAVSYTHLDVYKRQNHDSASSSRRAERSA